MTRAIVVDQVVKQFTLRHTWSIKEYVVWNLTGRVSMRWASSSGM